MNTMNAYVAEKFAYEVALAAQDPRHQVAHELVLAQRAERRARRAQARAVRRAAADRRPVAAALVTLVANATRPGLRSPR